MFFNLLYAFLQSFFMVGVVNSKTSEGLGVLVEEGDEESADI